jgi:hypothetical protein
MLDTLSSDIENVFVYVGDAVRFDYLPDDIRNMGVSIKTISGGIHSPTSFATIITGTYFPRHRVRGFSDSVPDTVPNLLHSTSHETAFVNMINNPPFNDNPSAESIITRTLGTTDAAEETVRIIDTPFILVERGPGGHAPYGDFRGNGTEYFEERGNASRDTFAREYGQSVKADCEWFRTRIEELRERDLLDSTLVIYTSDHGELLGEGGMLGHNGPIHRKLVEVPMVFIHPSLGTDDIQSKLAHHVDVTTTVSPVAGVEFNTDTAPDGIDLRNDSRGLGASYYTKRAFDGDSMLPSFEFSFESVWDVTGGYVFPTSNIGTRIAALSRTMTKSPKRQFYWHHISETVREYLSGARVCGTPQFSIKEGRSHLSAIESGQKGRTGKDTNEVPKDRLRELGYID